MNKIIPNGTEVLVFCRLNGQTYDSLDESKFIKGIIVSSKESEDLSYHGSPWYEHIYTVICENGEEYQATYGSNLINAYFIRTVEHQKECINNAIDENSEKIIDLNKKIRILEDSLASLRKDEYKIINKTSGPVKSLKKNN